MPTERLSQEVIDEIIGCLNPERKKDRDALDTLGRVNRPSRYTAHKIRFSKLILQGSRQGRRNKGSPKDHPPRYTLATFSERVKREPHIANCVKHISFRFIPSQNPNKFLEWAGLGSACELLSNVEEVEVVDLTLKTPTTDDPLYAPIVSVQNTLSKLLQSPKLAVVKIKGLSADGVGGALACYQILFSSLSPIKTLELVEEHPHLYTIGQHWNTIAMQNGIQIEDPFPIRSESPSFTPNLRHLTYDIPQIISFGGTEFIKAGTPDFPNPKCPIDISRLETLNVSLNSYGVDGLVSMVRLCHKTLRKLTIVPGANSREGDETSAWEVVHCQKLTTLFRTTSITFLELKAVVRDCNDTLLPAVYLDPATPMLDIALILKFIPEENKLEELRITLDMLDGDYLDPDQFEFEDLVAPWVQLGQALNMPGVLRLKEVSVVINIFRDNEEFRAQLYKEMVKGLGELSSKERAVRLEVRCIDAAQ